jgi:hypothetical protein
MPKLDTVLSAPAWETHASLIIGVVALVLAVLSLLQVFFGRPKIEFDFKTSTNKTDTALICYIRNRGIRSKFLRWLGVHRSPVEISADFGISEWNTNREIVLLERAIIHTDSQTGLHVDLPFAVSPARVLIVVHPEKEEAFISRNNGAKTGIPLPTGTYVAHIDVITAHQGLHTAHHRFTVGIEPASTYWVENPDDH